MTKKRKANDNYYQALKVYKNQCKKTELTKEGVRKVIADLKGQGFLAKLNELPKDVQEAVNSGKFKHYFPWRSVTKGDSLSTPVRVVVDPTMTGLNVCLPKGENKIASIHMILLRNRAHRLMWSTDIRKMYNQLKMNKASLRFQLLLYKESLDPNEDPEEWLLLSAWYGVVTTGN